MRRPASVFAAMLLAASTAACTEMLAAGAGAGYIVGSKVEEEEHEGD